jgi:hypothetical protein
MRRKNRVTMVLMAFLAIATIIGGVSCSSPLIKETTEKDTVTSSGVSGPADATVYGTVGGYVVDGYGKPLANVVVSYNTGVTSKTINHPVTDSKGWFEAGGLISGTHTIAIGDGLTTTMVSLVVYVPDLAELRDNSELPVVTDEYGHAVPTTSILQQYNGNYFVNISLNEGVDRFTVYPFTSTISGTAMVKNSSLLPDDQATPAPAGTKIAADFSSWNSSSLIFQGTVTGTTGAFTIANVPAVTGIFGEGFAIDFYLISEDGTTTAVDSINISDLLGNVAQATSSVDAGALLPNDIRKIGSLYFVEAIAPTIIDVSPYAPDAAHAFSAVLSSTRQNLVITFSKAMNTSRGTLTVEDAASKVYRATAAWNTSNTVLTITPQEEFPGDSVITALLEGYYSADDVAFYSDDSPVFYVAPVLGLLDSNLNVTTPYAGNFGFTVSSDITLKFNKTITRVDSLSLTKGGNLVELASAPSISGQTVTVNPAVDLSPNTAYALTFTVSVDYLDATGLIVGKESFTPSSPYSFTTAKAATAITAPALSLDSTRLEKNKSPIRSTYENGDTTAYVKFTKDSDPNTTYVFRYRLSTEEAWTVPGSPSVSKAEFDSTNYYATLTIPAVVSGKSLQIRLLASNTTTGAPSSYSNTITVADTTAPVATGTGTPSPATTGAFNNTAGTAAIFTTVTVTLSSEPIGSIAVNSSGTTAGVSACIVSTTFNTGMTSAVILFKIPVGTNLSGSTLALDLTDGAGNTYDNVSGGAVNPLTVTLP